MNEISAITCVISCSACAGKEGNRTDGSTQKEADAVGEEITPDARLYSAEMRQPKR